ncbi:MAG: hypothetical protein WD716_08965 [Fimbriimonadaceae bacterium]
MVTRLRLGLAIGCTVLLLVQGTVAAASALACMMACDLAKASRAQGQSCHGEKKAEPKCQSEQGCDGACSYVCSPEKFTATPSSAYTIQVLSFDVPAVLPLATDKQVYVPVVEPELFQTDSSPPLRSAVSTHSLRAPPVLSA